MAETDIFQRGTHHLLKALHHVLQAERNHVSMVGDRTNKQNLVIGGEHTQLEQPITGKKF